MSQATSPSATNSSSNQTFFSMNAQDKSSSGNQITPETTFGGDLSELTSKEDLIRILECPVCQEVAKTPIYNCSKGHIVCNKCRRKLNKCALCRADITDSRNFPLESIVSTSKFRCEYHEHGCNEIVSGSSLQEHLDECDYRPIPCHLGRMDGCNSSVLEIPEYFKHLKEIHNIVTGKEDNENSFVLRQTFRESTKNKHNWLCAYKKYDGHVFLTRTFKLGSMFYWSLAIIGSETEAAKYAVKITIRKSQDDDIPKFELTIPVLSIRKTKAEILDLPHAHLSETMLRFFCKTVETNDNKDKYQWRTQYTILNIAALQQQGSV